MDWQEKVKEHEDGQVTALIDVEDFLEHYQEASQIEEQKGILVCPYIPAVAKERGRWLENHMDALIRLLKKPAAISAKRLYVGNIGWILPFAERGVTVVGDAGLNVTNEATKKAYKVLGALDAMDSLEVSDGHTAIGWLPIMVTAHQMERGSLIERKGLRKDIVHGK